MNEDPEFKTMRDSYSALQSLSADARTRVLTYLFQRFGLNAPPRVAESQPDIAVSTAPTEEPDGGLPSQSRGVRAVKSFESLDACFSAANPDTDAEKILVVAAYLQVTGEQNAGVTALQVNTRLSHLGHKVRNISVVLSRETKKKPQPSHRKRRKNGWKPAENLPHGRS